MRVLGIDFGTSNTVAMLRMPDGRMRPLLFDGSPLLPSAVYLNADGRMLVGRDAERNARLDPSRFEPNPKRRIDDGHVFLGDRDMPVEQVFGQVLTVVAGEARRQLNGQPDEVRLTHPARWGEQRRRILTEAARGAGLRQPLLIAEPVGAASYFTAMLGANVAVGRSLAIYDLGGGTFDATVVRRTQAGFDVLAEEGLADVGGVDFDHAVVEHLGETYRMSHADQWSRLVNPVDAGDRRQRRMLYEDVRGAKEMLSRTTNADIHLPALEVDAHVTREEFEKLVRPYLERTIACLQRAIGEARVTPQELVGIFLVGGSSRIPLAAHMIHTSLGVAPTTLEQPETVVVEGALCIGSPVRPQPAGPQAPTSGPPTGHRPTSAPPNTHRPTSAPPNMHPTSGPPTTHRPTSGPPAHPVSTPPANTGPQYRPAQPVHQHPRPPVNLTRPAGYQRPPHPQQQMRPQPARMPQPQPQRPVQPQRPAQPQMQRPVQPQRPMSVPPRPAPQRQMPQRQAPAQDRAWHQEPAVIATIMVLAAVAIAFVVFLIVALSN